MVHDSIPWPLVVFSLPVSLVSPASPPYRAMASSSLGIGADAHG